MGAVTLSTCGPTEPSQAAKTADSRASSLSEARRSNWGRILRMLVISGSGFGRVRLSVFDLGPVSGEVEIGAVGDRMADSAACGRGHIAVAFNGVFRVLAARPVTGLALNVCELRSGDERLKSSGLLKSDDVASDAFIVELLALALKG